MRRPGGFGTPCLLFSMDLVNDPRDLAQSEGGAFVPTMGALHAGHTALMRRARGLAAPVVVSIFVNPAQFGPGEDLQCYPRSLDADLRNARENGVDVVFVPTTEVIYPEDEQIPVPPLPEAATRPALEDACRPVHFGGVCRVVARLFDLVRPSVAVFGEKDYQQLLVVRQLVGAQGERWPRLRIASHPTVREPDGLATSSRNTFLGRDERRRALSMWRALQAADDALGSGQGPTVAQERMRAVLTEHGLEVDYAVLRDARTLWAAPSPRTPARALVAARVGSVRLIDNKEVIGEW